MTSREVKKQFETKFNVKVDWFNDINKKNNTQRLKIRFVSDTTKPGVNLINSRRDEFFDYFKNELNLTVEKYQWYWMYENLDLWGNSQERKDASVIIIRNGLANLSLVGIPEINLAATLIELTS